MFGINTKKRIHEPVEQQRKELLDSIDESFRDVLEPKFINGLDCDQLPGGTGSFGSPDNPIPVNGLNGEIKYLSKLRGETGKAVMFHRIGSVHSNVCEDPVDWYEIVCIDGTQWNWLYFDLYHPRRSNITPQGYTLMPFNKKLGIDPPYGFGTNTLVSSFPQDLPEAILSTYGDSLGMALSRQVEEYLRKNNFNRPDSLNNRNT